jgi:catechol 2,3-dioxygenase-like lactoylglutathione lyase family enzyme
MIRSIDHIVILVDDLAAASADYAGLGFTVMPGGEHVGGDTHNALVIFADDAYLELIAFRRTAPGHRWWRHTAAGGGLVDYALLPGAIEQDIAAARERGAAYEGPTPGGRLRPDGQQVSWQIGAPPTADLPFLCGDVTPRVLRVPEGDLRRHANGVGGIAGVTIAVNDLDASAARYRALLGGGQPGPIFRLGAATITLAGPDGGAISQRLAARGEGIHALALRTDAAANAGPLDLGRTHGALIELVAG